MNGGGNSSRTAWRGWLLGPGRAVVALLLWRMYCTVERVQWNAPRLTPSFALAAGLNFYGTRTAGPFLGWVYGPVFPLYLLPAALVPNLNASFALAWGLNLAAFLVPAWMVARLALPSRPAAATALFFWTALALSGDVTDTQFYFLHVDTLCIGLVLLAGWALVRATARPESQGWLHGAAIWAALAIWTKQSAAAVPLIFLLWLLAAGERRLAGRFFVCTVLYGGLLAVAFMSWFGSERMMFNLVWIHLHNPTRPEGQAAFFRELLASSPGWLVAVGALVLSRRAGGAPPEVSPLARRMESLLGWLVVGNLPLGLVAASKVAGGWNSVHSLNFGLLLLALGLARQMTRPNLHRPGRLALALACGSLLVAGWLAAEAADLRWRPGTMQAAQLASARAHAGHIYLPWNPLVTLITDRRIYPFDDALVCLSRLGMPAPIAAVRRDIPRGALVVYPDPAQSQFALSYLAAAPPNQP
jgi:hypothetical protein